MTPLGLASMQMTHSGEPRAGCAVETGRGLAFDAASAPEAAAESSSCASFSRCPDHRVAMDSIQPFGITCVTSSWNMMETCPFGNIDKMMPLSVCTLRQWLPGRLKCATTTSPTASSGTSAPQLRIRSVTQAFDTHCWIPSSKYSSASNKLAANTVATSVSLLLSPPPVLKCACTRSPGPHSRRRAIQPNGTVCWMVSWNWTATLPSTQFVTTMPMSVLVDLRPSSPTSKWTSATEPISTARSHVRVRCATQVLGTFCSTLSSKTTCTSSAETCRTDPRSVLRLLAPLPSLTLKQDMTRSPGWSRITCSTQPIGMVCMTLSWNLMRTRPPSSTARTTPRSVPSVRPLPEA
mmetsp:Transcript_124487/g.311285  ORF Transcript_124487/g.311285 Transcript_124487/m.311285 type:complete len:350 (-) Transcript_124487:76-1125(-)